MTKTATLASKPAAKLAAKQSNLLLEICLLAGLYVMVGFLGLLCAGLFVPVVLALGGHENTAVLVTTEFVAVGSVPGLMMIYYCVFTLRRLPDRHPAIEVSPVDAPGLWDTVNEVAAAVGTRPPATLRVAVVANASVFEETRLLGFARGKRQLTIGMPLLLGLTAVELRAVLAHEMGHYAGGHTRLGAQVYRGSVALRNTCEALRAARESSSRRPTVRALWRLRSLYTYLAYGVFAVYSAFYDQVSFAARRRQELQADACAAENFGRDVTADALRAAHALPAAWSRFREGHLEPMRKLGYLPDDPFSAFEAMLGDPDFRDVLADLRQFPPEQPASRFDSHPTLDQRLIALMEMPAGAIDPGGPARSAGAIDLLSADQRQSISEKLQRAMFRRTITSRVRGPADLPWQEWVRTAAALQAAAPAAALVRAAGRLTDGPIATLHTVLDLLAAGRGGDLAAALAQDRGDPAETATPVLAGALFALIGHYLVETGRAGWAVGWTGPSRLIAADIATEELVDLVGAAVYQPATEVARLRLHLAALRIDPMQTGPVVSLLEVRAQGRASSAGDARVDVGVYLITAERTTTIRVWNIAVALVAGAVMLVGIHERDSAHAPPPFFPSASMPSFTSPPSPLGGYVPGAGIGIKFTPPPLPALTMPKLALLTRIVVKPGDSLSAIACRYGITIVALQRMNHLGSSTLIVPGERLTVPAFPFGLSAVC